MTEVEILIVWGRVLINSRLENQINLQAKGKDEYSSKTRSVLIKIEFVKMMANYFGEIIDIRVERNLFLFLWLGNSGKIV